MAKMGLSIRADPPKTIDMTGREFGQSADGLSLSIREIPREDPDELPAISIVLKNGGSERRTIEAPGWLQLYRVEIDAAPTAWGERALNQERPGAPLALTLGPGDATEMDLPAGQMYEMRGGREYRVRVASERLGLTSNEIVIRP